MDLWVTIGVLIKRWYITLPLLGLVGFAAVQIGNGIDPTYSATATGQVYCPDRALDPNTGLEVPANPFCGDRTTADLAVAARVKLESSLTRRDIREQGLAGDYVVDDTSAPLLDVYVEHGDPDVVIETLNVTMAVFTGFVDDEQPDDVFKFTAEAIDVPDQPDGVSSSKTRTQIIVVVAGLIFTTILVHMFDAAITTLGRRRAAAAEAAEAADDEADPSSDDAPVTPLTSARRDADDPEEDWEESKKLFDDEVEKLTGGSSGRWGR
ncbi:MAG: hypothetical protein ACR2QE_15745 [Acidimicrobiales bacterium]